MKPNPHSDPLDQKIDALLASRPLQPSDDFTARVLAATGAEESTVVSSKRSIGKFLAYALPLAAAIAIAFTWLQLNTETTEVESTVTLSTAEAQEIFLLEESLTGLATLNSTDLGSGDLLSTLDALYLEI